MLKRLTAIAVLVFSTLLIQACSVNPTTGRNQLNLLSRSEEISLGEEAKSQLAGEYGGVVGNASVQQYLSEIGMSMVGFTEADNAELPWEFTLLDSEVINAFALPGGKVFVSRGLAEKLGSEAELAMVVGHEIGHVTARHVNERISQQLMVGIGATIIGVIASQSEDQTVATAIPAVVGAGAGAYLLSYGRDQELEADALGMRYMSRAGYDPRAAYDMMMVLANESQGGVRPPEMLSTHPHPETRVNNIQTRLRQQYANASGSTYVDRYRQNLLSPMSLTLPAQRAMSEFETGAWCMHCRGEAEVAKQ